jgi:hypothetical protein
MPDFRPNISFMREVLQKELGLSDARLDQMSLGEASRLWDGLSTRSSAPSDLVVKSYGSRPPSTPARPSTSAPRPHPIVPEARTGAEVIRDSVSKVMAAIALPSFSRGIADRAVKGAIESAATTVAVSKAIASIDRFEAARTITDQTYSAGGRLSGGLEAQARRLARKSGGTMPSDRMVNNRPL